MGLILTILLEGELNLKYDVIINSSLCTKNFILQFVEYLALDIFS
jgi:hypothetical protein